MFDSVLTGRGRPRRRLGTGLAAAAGLHGLALAAGVALSTAGPPPARELELTFVPPAPAALPARAAAPAPRAPPRPAPARVPPPASAPAPAPAAPPPATGPEAAVQAAAPAAPAGAPPAAGDAVGTGAGGVAADEVAAAGGAGPPGAPAAPVDFDGRMTPPVKLSGPEPRYTPEALAREIEGTMTVRCVVGLDGRVRECRVVSGLPFLDRAAVEALERRVYRPATLAGAPVEVSYVFRISMRLP